MLPPAAVSVALLPAQMEIFPETEAEMEFEITILTESLAEPQELVAVNV